MHVIKCSTCNGFAKLTEENPAEILRLAKERRLRAYCARCDKTWPLSHDDQALIERNILNAK